MTRILVGALLVLAAVPSWTNAAPANDHRKDATSIQAVPFKANGNTSTATLESSEPFPFCAPISSTVWFKYTARETRPLAITTAGSRFDTVLALWRQTPEGLQHLECDDDSGMHEQSFVSFPAVSGDTYFIQLGGWPGDRGSYRLRVTNGARAGGAFSVVGVAADEGYVEVEFGGGAFVGGIFGSYSGGSVRVEDGMVEETRICASAGLIVAVERCT